MRTLNRYIGGSFLVTFAATVAVLTFVMSLASLFKVTDLLARGAPASGILAFFGYSFPVLLTFSLPMSLLTAALLVFGRMARDGELTAMKACGVSLWQAARHPYLWAALTAAVCLAMNFEVTPRIETRQRAVLAGMRAGLALSLLEEGRFMEMGPGLSLRLGRRLGDQVEEVMILQMMRDGSTRRIEAAAGTVRLSDDREHIDMELRDVRISPFMEGGSASGFVERWPIRMPVKGTGPAKPDEKRPESMAASELIEGIVVGEGEGRPAARAARRYRLIVETHKRLVLSLGGLVFVFLGVPLAVYNPRKESSASIGLSLLLAVLFYIAVIVPKSLGHLPRFHPHLLVWLPVAVSLILGDWLMRRVN